MEFEKDFRYWYVTTGKGKVEGEHRLTWVQFKNMPFWIQYTAYVDFFDEKGLMILIEYNVFLGLFGYSINNLQETLVERVEKTRQEARKAALEQAKIIYNGSK